jgi:hypothetical protein
MVRRGIPTGAAASPIRSRGVTCLQGKDVTGSFEVSGLLGSGDAVQFAYFLVAVMRWQAQAMVLSSTKAAILKWECEKRSNSAGV